LKIGAAFHAPKSPTALKSVDTMEKTNINEKFEIQNINQHFATTNKINAFGGEEMQFFGIRLETAGESPCYLVHPKLSGPISA